MGHARSRLVPALLVAVLATGAAGCSRVVTGSPTAAPVRTVSDRTGSDRTGSDRTTSVHGSVTAGDAGPTARGSVPAPDRASPPAPTSVAAGPPPSDGPPPGTDGAAASDAADDTDPAALEPDVLADECLLDAAQFTALVGRPMRAPEQSVVRRDDGSRSSSCYVEPVDGDAPVAAMNVYRVRTGSPARFVQAADGRTLPRTGVAAAVLDTPAGPTLQVASAHLLVTIAVQGGAPDDAAWRAAARAALARLPQ